MTSKSASAAGAAGEDVELLAAIAAGDAGALSALYDRHAPALFALTLRILRDRPAAEEVVSDVFFELWRRADRYDSARGSATAYLIGLTRSRAIDRHRAGRSERAHVVASTSEPSSEALIGSTDPGATHDATLRGQVAAAVRGALGSLSPVQRRAVELAYFDGLSHSEVAAELGEPLGTVKSRIREGLMRLRDALLPIHESGALP